MKKKTRLIDKYNSEVITHTQAMSVSNSIILCALILMSVDANLQIIVLT